MTKHYFLPLLVFCSFSEASFANHVVDCSVVSTTDTRCNPYGRKLIKAKEISYDVDRKKLIVVKTLPAPKKKTIKVISVEDMIEKYIHIESPIRFYNDSKIFSSPYEKTLISKVTSDTNTTILLDKVQENTSLDDYGNYTVVKGDILGRIANKFQMTTKELLALNHLDANVTLKIGQLFKILMSQKMVDAIASATYTIESGDTLLLIAHRFKLDPKLLVKFNHLQSSSMIREGKILTLPLPYMVKKLEEEEKRILAKKKKEAEKKKKIARLKKQKTSHISKKNLRVKNRGIGKHKLRVTATAYSSHRRQTDKTPFLAAWNNRLRPGMKIIAVSRDLLKRYGLRNGTKVRIGGLRGYYRVRDKMNKRFRKRIDIYMGINRRRALRWGRRSVILYW